MGGLQNLGKNKEREEDANWCIEYVTNHAVVQIKMTASGEEEARKIAEEELGNLEIGDIIDEGRAYSEGY